MRKEFITTEQDKDVVLEKRRAELDSLSIAINESKKELEDIHSEKKDKIKELARVVKTFDENDTLINSRIDSLKDKTKEQKDKLIAVSEQVNQLIATREEVQAVIDSLNGVLEAKKAQIDIDTAQYEKDATKKSKELAKSISEQTELYSELSAQVELLRTENAKLSANVVNGNQLVSDAYKTVNDLEKKESELDTNIKAKVGEVFNITSDIEKKRTVLEVLTEKETATQEAIIELNKRKDALIAGNTAMEKEIEDFNSQKLAFSEDKQLILAKEQFIKEKYELAGLKYE